MPSFKPFATATNTLRARLSPSLRTRGGGGGGPSRWTSPGHEERPKGFAFKRTPPPPGESRKWEDWELPCYLTSFLTIVILSHAYFKYGNLVKCEIYGEVQVNSNLPGLPDLTISFANPSVFNDVRFHPCIRLRPWESNQILSFVPPDGQFKLMSYRVKNLKNTPIYVKPQFTSDSGTCRISVLVGIRSDPGKTIDSITVQFRLPPCALSSDLSSNYGAVNVLADKTCLWTIGRMPKDKAPSMSGTLVLETGMERLQVFPTFEVGFKIMGVALSGLKIDKLDIKNPPVRPHKGFRALTKGGEFQVRS